MQSLQLDNRPLQSRKRTHFLSSDLLWKRVRQNYQRPFITNIFRNGICQEHLGEVGECSTSRGGIAELLAFCRV